MTEVGREDKVTDRELEMALESGSAAKWSRRIRENGAALVHGKFHPKWFQQRAEQTKNINPLEDEPGFADAGHINCSPKSLTHARSPLAGIPNEIFRYGSLLGAKRAFEEKTQIVLLSPATPPSDEYNLRMLDSRFQSPYREVVWAAKVNKHKDIPQLRKSKVDFILKVFLPDQEAVQLLQDIGENPRLPEQLMRNMYPNLPVELVDTSRVFIKELSASDVEKPHLGPVEEGGEFLSLNN